MDYQRCIEENTLEVGARRPVVFTSGQGCEVEDTSGRRYLDLTSGQVCSIIGHCPPALHDTIVRQIRKLTHVHSGFYCEEELLLARKLAELNGNELTRSFFLNTGGEAVELAQRMAKVATGKFEFVSLERSWHGMTTGAVALKGIPTYKQKAGPFAPGFIHIPAPDCYRCAVGKDRQSCQAQCLDASEQTVDATSTGQLAGLVVEPVLAGGGILVPPAAFFRRLRRFCDQREAFLIFDECQTGAGRTGSMFAYQQLGVVPDILVLAKGLGGGFPASAVVTTDRISKILKSKDFKYLTSHMGDPFPCRMALTTIEIIEKEGLVDKARELGEYFVAGLKDLQEKHPIIGDVRGRGLMIGLEIVEDRQTKAPGIALGDAVIRMAMDRGLIMNLVVPHNIIRIVPPITISAEQIDRAVSTLDSVFSEVVARRDGVDATGAQEAA